VYFCIHDLNLNPTRAKPGLGAGFVFHPRVHPDPKKSEIQKKPEKNPKPERNPKKLETQKKPGRNMKKNLKETHLQNPMDTRTRPETRRI
jgi:hypothetical protein